MASNLSHNGYENRLISDINLQILWIISFCQMCRFDPLSFASVPSTQLTPLGLLPMTFCHDQAPQNLGLVL